MQSVVRSLRDYRELWRAWLPLLVLSILTPVGGVALPLVEKQLVDNVVLARKLALLPQTLILYGALWLLATAGLLVASALRTYLDERLALRLRQQLYTHRQELSIAFSGREHSGRTMSLFLNDIPAMAGLFSTLLTGIVGTACTVVLGVVVMLSLNPPLAVAAGVIPPVVAGVAWLVMRPLRPAMRWAQEKAAELTEQFQESLAGMREIVAFGRQQAMEARFVATLRELLRLRMRVTLMDTGMQTGQLLLSLAITTVVFGYGGYLVIEGRTTLGTVLAMRALFGLIFQPASQLASMVSATQKALGASDRVYAALDAAPEVREPSEAVVPAQVAGAVEFDAVRFGYQPGYEVLRDVSFAVAPGELVALVGPSGAGKSTLLSLLARFYDPSSGSIALDGVDLREWSLAALRGTIGVVFQDSFLFASTVRENIAFGRPDADDAAIERAARQAQAWEFIAELPHGLETQMGERGIRLSEGQKQRIAIARALLRDPRILILDEPTSALDARSEHLLNRALDQLTRGRTTLVIAHRLATVRRADRILVVDGGRIVEQGTHAQLLARSGLYRELYDLHFAGHAAESEEPAPMLAALPEAAPDAVPAR